MNAPATNPARKRLLLLATGAFVLIAIAYGIWWALFGAHFENTDDAYVHGNLVQITPQVPGTIVAIEADDTETVSAGQPLVRLDSADTDVALQQAQAKLAQTVRQVAPITCRTMRWPPTSTCAAPTSCAPRPSWPAPRATSAAASSWPSPAASAARKSCTPKPR